MTSPRQSTNQALIVRRSFSLAATVLPSDGGRTASIEIGVVNGAPRITSFVTDANNEQSEIHHWNVEIELADSSLLGGSIFEDGSSPEQAEFGFVAFTAPGVFHGVVFPSCLTSDVDPCETDGQDAGTFEADDLIKKDPRGCEE